MLSLRVGLADVNFIACRWVGSLCAIAVWCWRWVHYPEDYPLVGTPMAVFLFVMTEVADILYFVVYINISEKEKLKAS